MINDAKWNLGIDIIQNAIKKSQNRLIRINKFVKKFII